MRRQRNYEWGTLTIPQCLVISLALILFWQMIMMRWDVERELTRTEVFKNNAIEYMGEMAKILPPRAIKILQEDISILENHFVSGTPVLMGWKIFAPYNCLEDPCYVMAADPQEDALGTWDGKYLRFDPSLIDPGDPIVVVLLVHEIIHVQQDYQKHLLYNEGEVKKGYYPWEDEAHASGSLLLNAMTNDVYSKYVKQFATRILAKKYKARRTETAFWVNIPQEVIRTLYGIKKPLDGSLRLLNFQFTLDVNKEIIRLAYSQKMQASLLKTLYSRLKKEAHQATPKPPAANKPTLTSS